MIHVMPLGTFVPSEDSLLATNFQHLLKRFDNRLLNITFIVYVIIYLDPRNRHNPAKSLTIIDTLGPVSTGPLLCKVLEGAEALERGLVVHWP